MTAVLLSSALLVGCGDRGNQNDQNLAENHAPAPSQGTGGDVAPPSEAVPPASSDRDTQVDTRTGAAARPGATTERAPRTSTRADAPLAERRAPAPAAAAPSVPRAQWREVTIPAGTSLPLELTTAVSSRTATVETPVSARLRTALVIDGNTVLPAGTVLDGQVIDVERPGRVQGRARLALRFTEARVDGAREDLRTNPITFEGEATKGEDATKIGAGAGVGAIIGGIVGGGDGAAKGAAIGGAAGTGAVLATRGRDVELTTGTDIAATVASPVTLRISNK